MTGPSAGGDDNPVAQFSDPELKVHIPGGRPLSKGCTDAVLVNYTENGTRYVLRTSTAVEIKHQPLQC